MAEPAASQTPRDRTAPTIRGAGADRKRRAAPLTRPAKDKIKVTGGHNGVGPGFTDKAFLVAIAYCR